MKVLLTGGSGLVGRTLVPLLRKNHEVVHFDSRDPEDGLPWIPGDVRERAPIEKACGGMDAVIHSAAIHGKVWREVGDDVLFDVNVTGTKNVLEAAVKNGLKRMVFVSSIRAMGSHAVPADYVPVDEMLPREPMNLYGLTKRLGEDMCRYYTRNFGISTLCLRPGNVLPADDSAAPRWRLLFTGVDVRDVAKALLLAVEADERIKHDTFIITARSRLCEISGDEFRKDPVAALEGLYPGISELMGEEQRELFPKLEWYTVEKAMRVLGYAPGYNFELKGRQG